MTQQGWHVLTIKYPKIKHKKVDTENFLKRKPQY